MAVADGDAVACSTLCTAEDAVLLMSGGGRAMLLPVTPEDVPLYKAKGSKGVKVGPPRQHAACTTMQYKL